MYPQPRRGTGKSLLHPQPKRTAKVCTYLPLCKSHLRHLPSPLCRQSLVFFQRSAHDTRSHGEVAVVAKMTPASVLALVKQAGGTVSYVMPAAFHAKAIVEICELCVVVWVLVC